MNEADGQGTRNRLSALVASSLDTQTRTQDLARQAYQSRTQFHRLFRAAVEETPAAMRRRLLLERAAYQQRRSLALSEEHFGLLPASTGACVIRTFVCPRPTRFRITEELRNLFVDIAPPDDVPVVEAMRRLGVSRQTVWQRVKSGELEALHVRQGKRKGLRIRAVDPPDPPAGLFD